MTVTLGQAVGAIEREARWHDDVARRAVSPIARAQESGRVAGLRAAARMLRDVEGAEAPPTVSPRVASVEPLGHALVIVTGEADEGVVRVAVPSYDAPEPGELLTVERWQVL